MMENIVAFCFCRTPMGNPKTNYTDAFKHFDVNDWRALHNLGGECLEPCLKMMDDSYPERYEIAENGKRLLYFNDGNFTYNDYCSCQKCFPSICKHVLLYWIIEALERKNYKVPEVKYCQLEPLFMEKIWK